MAAEDSDSVFSLIDGVLTVGDGGANSLIIELVSGELNFQREGAPYTEAKNRNKHAPGGPILRKTGQGNITGSLSCLAKSFRGDTAVTPYEALTRTGLAASWANTAKGDKKASEVVLALDASAADGASQTLTFAYVVFTSVKVDPSADNLWQISADFTDHEEDVTIA